MNLSGLVYIYIYTYICMYLSELSWLVGFYGISTFVGYLMPNPVLYKQFSLAWVHSLILKKFLFQAIQFCQTVLTQPI